MRLIRGMLLVLCSTLALACREAPDGLRGYVIDPPGMPPDLKEVSVVFLIRDSHYASEAGYVIENESELTEFWRGGGFSADSKPAIDFNDSTLVAIAAGMGSSTAPEVRFLGFREEEVITAVYVLIANPESGCAATDDLISMVIGATIPRTATPATIRFVRAIRPC
jgi:hypothetical protein